MADPDWAKISNVDKARMIDGWGAARNIMGPKMLGPHAILPKVQQAARRFAAENPAIQAYLEVSHGEGWNGPEFVQFCKDAWKSQDEETLGFCRKVMNAEWRFLVEHVLGKVAELG